MICYTFQIERFKERLRMVLPLARTDKNTIHFPSKDALLKCMSLVANSAEGAEYLCEKFEERCRESKLEGTDAVVDKLRDFVTDVVLRSTSIGKNWDGKETTHIDYAQKVAEEAVATLFKEATEKPIHLDFAVSDDSNLIRGYSTNGQKLDEAKSQEAGGMDKLLRSFLAENGWEVDKEGFIFERPPEGKKQEVKAQAEKIREKIENPNNGFKSYVDKAFAKEKKGIDITIQQHAHPDNLAKGAPKAEEGAGRGGVAA